jgi:hypothetical protein
MTQWFQNKPSAPLHPDPNELCDMLLKIIAQMDRDQMRYERACREYVTYHTQYELRKAQEILKAEGPQSIREATATVIVQQEYLAYMIAKAKMGAMRERLLTLRAEQTALQSLLRRQQEEWDAAGAVQKYGT